MEKGAYAHDVELLVSNVIDPEKAWSGQHAPSETLWKRAHTPTMSAVPPIAIELVPRTQRRDVPKRL
jgi:hypothetical protein